MKAFSNSLLFLLSETGRRVFNGKWQDKTKTKTAEEQEPMPMVRKRAAISEYLVHAKPVSTFSSDSNNSSEK